MGSETVHKLGVIEFTDKNTNPETESWWETCNLQKAIRSPNSNRGPKQVLYGYVGQIPFLPLYTIQVIQNFSNVMWHIGNPAFDENLVVYTKLAAEVERIAVRMVCESYGVGKYYDSYVESANYLCRTKVLCQLSIKIKLMVSRLKPKMVNGSQFITSLPPPSSSWLAWSNKRIKSPHHRVTMEGNEARYSIAQFSFMEKDMVATPDEFVDQDHPQQYKPFDHLKFLDFFSQEENRKLESAITTYCGVSQ
ncbi:deoxypodophyllotoxin synthase-like [Salvia miltiorrhiza]|uniref:deoxypodophyllotoxin synthase-like n=1 Tax=Salvia miltiorrhiza TaxID=226208 RepID=UPI0025ACC278|nr:deoxypodophyllotoxin synthase-like [Salvia miltiorrhiza]